MRFRPYGKDKKTALFPRLTQEQGCFHNNTVAFGGKPNIIVLINKI